MFGRGNNVGEKKEVRTSSVVIFFVSRYQNEAREKRHEHVSLRYKNETRETFRGYFRIFTNLRSRERGRFCNHPRFFDIYFPLNSRRG